MPEFRRITTESGGNRRNSARIPGEFDGKGRIAKKKNGIPAEFRQKKTGNFQINFSPSVF